MPERPRMRGKRYHALYDCCEELVRRKKLMDEGEFRFLEVGTYDGKTSRKVIGFLNALGADVCYYGFDMWEQMTKPVWRKEISKRVMPPAIAGVREKLEKLALHVSLFQGDTKVTLPEVVGSLPKMDLIYIDGGHSADTVLSDWENVSKLADCETIILMDDWYERHPDIGARVVTTHLEKNPSDWKVEVLRARDDYSASSGYIVQMVKVTHA